MRVDLATTGKVRAGHTVRISLRLRKGMDLGRVTVWARSGDDKFSPYINEDYIAAQGDDKPKLLSPVAFRLTERRSRISVEFVSETDQEFKLVQECDRSDEPRVRARIKGYGKTAETLRRYRGNALRFIRRCFQAPPVGNV